MISVDATWLYLSKITIWGQRTQVPVRRYTHLSATSLLPVSADALPSKSFTTGIYWTPKLVCRRCTSCTCQPPVLYTSDFPERRQRLFIRVDIPCQDYSTNQRGWILLYSQWYWSFGIVFGSRISELSASFFREDQKTDGWLVPALLTSGRA